MLKDVEPRCTVVGVPARSVGKLCSDTPSQTMDQYVDDDGTELPA